MKTGDILKHKDGSKVKILGICGEVIFISEEDDHQLARGTVLTVKDLTEMGYILPKEKWCPEKNETYWTVDGDGSVWKIEWDGYSTDGGRLEMNNVHRTEQDAIEFRDKIKAL